MINLGRGMMVTGCIIGMIVLTLFFGNLEENQRNPNRDPDSRVNDGRVEVILERNRQGHYLSGGRINGYPVEFLLDTGATDVVVPGSLAEKIGLKRGRAGKALTAGGTVTVYDTMVDELRIGELTLYNVSASINPQMNLGGILLGMSALKEVEFTQRGDQLTLVQY